MINIKFYIYSFIILLVISSLGIAYYSHNKIKNQIIEQQKSNIVAQEQSINLYKNSQEEIDTKLTNLNTKNSIAKKELDKKLQYIETSDKKEVLYKNEFNQILDEIEVVSGKNSTN